jgi:hypothetical protein
LVAAVSGLKTHAALQTRVGMATGLVVVGDLIGSGASQEQAIVGETPNLAARLQGVAEPNSVLIAESTRKLVGNLFELEDLGAQDLRGEETLPMWSKHYNPSKRSWRLSSSTYICFGDRLPRQTHSKPHIGAKRLFAAVANLVVRNNRILQQSRERG